eukprot:COSAG03_NODE_473_length_7642_cov_10.379425_4_plen_44_part_00
MTSHRSEDRTVALNVTLYWSISMENQISVGNVNIMIYPLHLCT